MGEIEIPSHFLCPISLQLMRDPVTISTGITYDRENIERWLFLCKHTTCPVTKQVLITTPTNHHDHLMLTPNHTLRRLIQSWCTLHSSDGVDRIPTPKQPSATVNRAHIVKLISDARRSPHDQRYACLQRIRSLCDSSSPRNKKVLEACGAFQYAASVVTDDGNPSSFRDKEEALFILAQLEEEELKPIVKNNNNDQQVLVDSLVQLIRSSEISSDGRELVLKLLRSIYKVADPNQLANAKVDFFIELVKVIRNHNRVTNQSTKYALKLLVELNPWGRNRVKAVGSGAVGALVELLFDGGADRRACEVALVVMDQLCGCAEGRADLVGHGAGLAVVSKKILRVSHVASDRAVRILSSVSRYSATDRVVAEMVEVGVVAKLCLVIQVDCSAKTKERAKEILRLHSRVWRFSPCIPPHLLSSYPL